MATSQAPQACRRDVRLWTDLTKLEKLVKELRSKPRRTQDVVSILEGANLAVSELQAYSKPLVQGKGYPGKLLVDERPEGSARSKEWSGQL